MVTVVRVAGDKEGNGNGGKRDGNSNTGGGQVTAKRAMVMATTMCGQRQQQRGWWVTMRARARAARAMMTTMRVASNGEGKGDKMMATATRVVGKQTVMAMKRAMMMKKRLGGTGGGDDQPLHTSQQ